MTFHFADFFWQAAVTLPEWGPFTGGQPIQLTFAPEGRDDSPLAPEEQSLVEWVPAHQTLQQPVLLTAVLAAYPALRQQYFEDFDLRETEDDLPHITAPADLCNVMTLQEVCVHQIAHDGAPYVGFTFDCAWDGEHGLGVLMHKDRVVRLGGADTASLLWIAEQDRDAQP